MTYIVENVSEKILSEFCLMKTNKCNFIFMLDENKEDYLIFLDKIISITNYNYDYNWLKLFTPNKDYVIKEINFSFNGKIEFVDEETAFYFKLKYC